MVRTRSTILATVMALAAVVVLVRSCSALTSHAPKAAPAPAAAVTRHIAILCYHDLSTDPRAPQQSVSPEFLRRQIHACRATGWTFISLRQLLAHRTHPELLPERSLVLTFDDGYRSFRELALPILHEERVPVTLAVISGFVNTPITGLPPLMNWDELREVASDSLVEIASHTHNLHRYDSLNPYRDTAPSVGTRRYLLAESRYENREEYRSRIRGDLDTSRRVLQARLGTPGQVLVWPYGMHNEMARGIAAQLGFRATLALGQREVTPADLRSDCLPRIMVTRRLRFDADETWLKPPPIAMRAADVDLDDVYSPDPNVLRDRVDRLVKRVSALGATHVFLSVGSDSTSEGELLGTWCMNHQLRVRADVWSMVASKFAHAQIRVWARVPTMNLTWVWQQHPEWRVGVRGSGTPARWGIGQDGHSLAAEWPTRLSPDLPDVRRAAIDFLTDIAVYAPIDGIVFDGDAAMASNERLALTPSARPRVKAEAIDDLLGMCRDAVRAWRPECRFGRVVDASVVEISGVHSGLSQDYSRIVRDVNVAVVNVDPWRSGHQSDAPRWVERLGHRALQRGGEAEASASPYVAPMLLQMPVFDRSGDRWVPGRDLAGLVAAARRAGVSQVGLRRVTPDLGDIPAALLVAPSSQVPLTVDAP